MSANAFSKLGFGISLPLRFGVHVRPHIAQAYSEPKSAQRPRVAF